MSSTCISWLTQSCFPSAPPCLWIQKWEIFRIQTCLKPLSSIAHQNIMWVCVASDPPRSIQRDELLRGSTNEEHLGSGPRILHGTLTFVLWRISRILRGKRNFKWFIFSSWHLPLTPLEDQEESPLEMIMFKFYGWKLLEHYHPA